MAWERQGLKLSHGISSDGKKEDGFVFSASWGGAWLCTMLPRLGFTVGSIMW